MLHALYYIRVNYRGILGGGVSHRTKNEPGHATGEKVIFILDIVSLVTLYHGEIGCQLHQLKMTPLKGAHQHQRMSWQQLVDIPCCSFCKRGALFPNTLKSYCLLYFCVIILFSCIFLNNSTAPIPQSHTCMQLQDILINLCSLYNIYKGKILPA